MSRKARHKATIHATHPEQRPGARTRHWLEPCASAPALCLVAVGLALALYWRTLGYEFIDLDDTAYVLNNPHVLGGLGWASARWALVSLTYTVGYWHPVTWLSLMIDASLFGQWAGGYHATSFLLHTACVALVFLLVRRITADKWAAFAVAAIFAVHPAHLESVVWITERKDVLFMFWGLLALNSYLTWARDRSRPALIAFYCCYAASLMSKPVLVVLPGLLLLLDYWPLRRWSPYELFTRGGPELLGARLRAFWPLLREKLPMLALAALSTLATIHTTPKLHDLIVVDAQDRLGNAFLSLARYAWKYLWPTDLSLFYPFRLPLPVWPLVLSIAGLLAALLFALRNGRHRPWLLLGLGWFLLGLLTTIIIPGVGMQVALADRFAYFPYLGASLLVVLGAREAAARLVADERRRHALLALGLAGLLGWYWVQADYAIGFWRDKYTIYERAIDLSSEHHILYNNYGKLLVDRGDFGRAEVYVRKSLALQPGYTFALGNLGNIFMATGRFEEAIGLFQRALAPDPHYIYSADDHYGIAYCLSRLGRYNEAEAQYLQVLASTPNYPKAHNDLGNIALLRGDLRRAEEYFAKAVALAPDYRVASENLERVRRMLAAAK